MLSCLNLPQLKSCDKIQYGINGAWFIGSVKSFLPHFPAVCGNLIDT